MHEEQIPLRSRARPSWVSYCMSAVRVVKPAAAGAAFQVRLFIVGRILLFGFCSPSPSPAPQAVRPEPRKSEGHWQLSGPWGLDRPPRLKGSGDFSFMTFNALPENREYDNRKTAPQRRFEAHSTDEGLMKSNYKNNKKKSENFFKLTLYDRHHFQCSAYTSYLHPLLFEAAIIFTWFYR